jgi:hypothetical protein
MKIPKEYRTLYTEEVIRIRIAIFLLAIIALATLTLPFLVFLCIIPKFNLWFWPLFFILYKKELDHLFIQRSVLFFKRYLIEPDFANEFNFQHNILNSNEEA